MSDEDSGQSADGRGRQAEAEAERAVALYGSGVRTTLRNNATAYGFSVSITAGYGLTSGASGTASAMETVSFAMGAVVAFIAVAAGFIARKPRARRLSESGQVMTISGGVDLLSVVIAVTTAFGASQLPGFAAWPVTAFATVSAYLLVGGLDLVIAQRVARHTTVAEGQ